MSPLSSIFNLNQDYNPDNPFMKRKLNLYQDGQAQSPLLDVNGDDEEEQTVTGEEPPNRIQSLFSDIYNQLASQESGPRAKEYAEFVKHTPTREQYKPGKLNRLGAILSGISETIKDSPARGIALTRQILDEPYNRAVEDYKLKGSGLKVAADQEEKDMGRRVSLARTIATDVHNTEGEKIKGRELDIRLSKMKADEKIAMRRALGAGMKFITNKNTGESFFSFPQYDEDGVTPKGILKLSAGKTDESIPEATKRKMMEFGAKESAIGRREKDVEGVRQKGRESIENMRREGAMDVEYARAVDAEELADKKGEIQSSQIGQRGEEQRKTNEAKAKNVTPKGQTPSAEHRVRLNTIERMASDPDNIKHANSLDLDLNDFIVKDKTGHVVDIKKPTYHLQQWKQADADKLYARLAKIVNGEK